MYIETIKTGENKNKVYFLEEGGMVEFISGFYTLSKQEIQKITEKSSVKERNTDPIRNTILYHKANK